MSDADKGPGFTPVLNTLESEESLDPYQFRMLIHIMRVGVSWETYETLAKACCMSAGKAYKVKQELIEGGWIVPATKDGHMGHAAANPLPCESSPHEDTQQLKQGKSSPHEDLHSPGEDLHSPGEAKQTKLSKPNEALNKGENQQIEPNGLGLVVSTYEELNEKPKNTKFLEKAISQYPADWVDKAIREAKFRGGEKWTYTLAILNNWKNQGQPTVTYLNGHGPDGDQAPAIDEKTMALAAAIAEVCHKNLAVDVHQRACVNVARQLNGYGPETVRDKFGEVDIPAGWNWYVNNWLGRDKREPPKPNDVLENIANELVETAFDPMRYIPDGYGVPDQGLKEIEPGIY